MSMYSFPLHSKFGAPSTPSPPPLSGAQRAAIAAVAIGALLFFAAWLGAPLGQSWLGPTVTFLLLCGGAILWFVLKYKDTTPGIKSNGIFFSSAMTRGAWGWGLGIFMTGFYVLLYWFPAYLDGAVRLVDPISYGLARQPANQWFLYGFLYTVSMIVFGVRMFMKYRHNRYHLIRTGSVVFFQLGLAFLLPNFLKALNQPEFYFSYFWPLKPEYFFPSDIGYLREHPGGLGFFFIAWAVIMSFVATPVLTFFFGKRWYCSWVCGCGGLAETLGDPWRHLSDKSTRVWKIERWMIHGVLVAIIGLTAVLWINEVRGGGFLGEFSSAYRRQYGFFIGMFFSGVAGVGFYPVLGSRVWCRFGCPMAAILGIFQRFFSRFRITTNGGQCMSCGNCSTHCEMGIDVRAYAQRGENIVRASCVGCGVCAAVCPRGVLRLENGEVGDRFAGAEQPASAFLQSLGLKRRQTGRGSYWS